MKYDLSCLYSDGSIDRSYSKPNTSKIFFPLYVTKLSTNQLTDEYFISLNSSGLRQEICQAFPLMMYFWYEMFFMFVQNFRFTFRLRRSTFRINRDIISLFITKLVYDMLLWYVDIINISIFVYDVFFEPRFNLICNFFHIFSSSLFLLWQPKVNGKTLSISRKD